jgi:hypothetical protein
MDDTLVGELKKMIRTEFLNVEIFTYMNFAFTTTIGMVLIIGLFILWIQYSRLSNHVFRVGERSRTYPPRPPRSEYHGGLSSESVEFITNHHLVRLEKTFVGKMEELKGELLTTVRSIETHIDLMPPVAGEKFVEATSRWGGPGSAYIGVEATLTPSNEEEGKKEEEEGKGAEKKKRV